MCKVYELKFTVMMQAGDDWLIDANAKCDISLPLQSYCIVVRQQAVCCCQIVMAEILIAYVLEQVSKAELKTYCPMTSPMNLWGLSSIPCPAYHGLPATAYGHALCLQRYDSLTDHCPDWNTSLTSRYKKSLLHQLPGQHVSLRETKAVFDIMLRKRY